MSTTWRGSRSSTTSRPAAVGHREDRGADGAELESVPDVPEIAEFSSRGPSTTTGGDILKPDIAAPGVDVVAAVAPPSNNGRLWDVMSGTSMASPHIAGIGALIMAKHPTWLPSEIKSALMTSAGDTVSSSRDPFAQGAGFVNPNGAADPGLVYPHDRDRVSPLPRWPRRVVRAPVRHADGGRRFRPEPGIDRDRQPRLGQTSLGASRTSTRRPRRSPRVQRSGLRRRGHAVRDHPRAGAEQTFSVRFTRTDAGSASGRSDRSPGVAPATSSAARSP